MTDLSSLDADPRLFLYTSLTAGSSHIITATSRLETILKANRIPFQAIDIATDEKARKLWQRRSSGKKIPGLVKEGFVIGDLEEIEEWNEFGELKENIGPVPAHNAPPPAGGQTGVNIAPPISIIPTATAGTANVGPAPSAINKAPTPGVDASKMVPLPGAAEMAARNKENTKTSSSSGDQQTSDTSAKTQPQGTSVIDEPVKAETMTSAPAVKEESVEQAKSKEGQAEDVTKKDHPAIQHLSAPASAIGSGAVTPSTGEQGEEEVAKTEEGGGKAVEGMAEEGESAAVAASKEDAKKPTASTAQETQEGNAAKDDAAKGVQGLRVGEEGAETQAQEAKDGDEATTSVED